jgi:hypothetical protein
VNDDNLFIPNTYLSTLLDTVLNIRKTHQEFDMQVTFHSELGTVGPEVPTACTNQWYKRMYISSPFSLAPSGNGIFCQPQSLMQKN